MLKDYDVTFFDSKALVVSLVQDKKGPYNFSTQYIMVQSDGYLKVELIRENSDNVSSGEFLSYMIYEVNKSDIAGVNNAGINIKIMLN